MINETFPSLATNVHSSTNIISATILSTENEHAGNINEQIFDTIVLTFDEAENNTNNFYHLEFLNSLNVSGLPSHYLRLKIVCFIILLGISSRKMNYVMARD